MTLIGRTSGAMRSARDDDQYFVASCSVQIDGKKCRYPADIYGICRSHRKRSEKIDADANDGIPEKIIQESHDINNLSDSFNAGFLSPCLRETKSDPQ